MRPLLRLLVMVLVAGALPARAGKPSPVEKLAADAANAYRASNFKQAAELLEKAYEMQPLSAILYNLGRAYEKLGDNEKALDRYQRYVMAEDGDPRLRIKAESRVRALSPATTRPETPTTNTTPEPPILITPPPIIVSSLPSRATTPPPPQPEMSPRERARRRDRGLAITFSILGVAMLGTGIGLGVSAQSTRDQFAATVTETAKRSLASDARNMALAADVLYALGAAAIAGSVIFYVKWLTAPPSHRAQSTRPRAMLLPWLAPGAAGIAAGGTF